MAAKPIMRCLCITVLFVLLLVSCRGGEAIPNASPYAVTGTNTYAATPLEFNAPLMPSTAPSFAVTITEMVTPTNSPHGFVLKNWREPMEVITPENMDRVVKIGELEFPGGVWRFSWSPDGSWFGVIAHRSFVILDAYTFAYKLSASGNLVVFSYDGQILETGIYQYDLVTGEQIRGDNGIPLELYPNSVLDAEFSPDGKFIAAAGTIHAQIYPMKPGVEAGEFGRYGNGVMHTSVGPDSRIVASNYDGDLYTELWDPYLRQPVRILKLKNIGAQGKPRFAKGGTSLFFTGQGTWEGKDVTYLQEWDYRTGRPLSVQWIPGDSMEKGASMDISPVSMVAAMGTMKGKIYLLPIHDCRARIIGENDTPEDPVYMIGFRPDGRLIATIGWSGNNIDFWGIPASAGKTETNIPTGGAIITPDICQKIPMEIEQPLPENDWFGGGRPYK
jgi:WD40 repeat protein